MEIPNDPQSINRDADPLNGFVLEMQDGSQIDGSSDVDENGVTLGAGFLATDDQPAAWGEVRMSWTAARALADELNAMLRAASVKGWTD
jgi:hypothetical protein